MTTAFFDCFSGISGDMTLGALIDLGVPADWLKEQLAHLPLTGFDIRAQKVMRNGIGATQVQVVADETHHHRNFGHIRRLIEDSTLPATVKTDSLAIFTRLAEAEARIHGNTLENVHFHEVGGIDAIVDIVGACLARKYLGIDTIIVSPLPLGRGFVNCAHGVLPVPAPAVLEILKRIPVYSGTQQKELVTPTGAAIAAALAVRFEPMPPMNVSAIGYGAGTHVLADQPNLLRVLLGTLADGQSIGPSDAAVEQLVMVETGIDDMNPEIYGFLMERLFAEGALDVCWVPVQMKKNRPGILVQALCRPEKRSALTACLLSESTSLGVRWYDVQRAALAREAMLLQTELGSVAAKKVSEIGGGSRIIPEFESCRRIALEKGVPLRQVYQAVACAADAIGFTKVLMDKQQLDKNSGKL